MAIDEHCRLEIQRGKNREVSRRQLEAKAKAAAKAVPKEPSYPPPSTKGKGKGGSRDPPEFVSQGDDAPYRLTVDAMIGGPTGSGPTSNGPIGTPGVDGATIRPATPPGGTTQGAGEGLSRHELTQAMNPS